MPRFIGSKREYKRRDCFRVYIYTTQKRWEKKRTITMKNSTKSLSSSMPFFYNQYRSRRGHKLGWFSCADDPRVRRQLANIETRPSTTKLSLPSHRIAFYSQRAYEEPNLNHFQPPPVLPLALYGLLPSFSNYPPLSSGDHTLNFQAPPLIRRFHVYTC